jgi:hypothetical protein
MAAVAVAPDREYVRIKPSQPAARGIEAVRADHPARGYFFAVEASATFAKLSDTRFPPEIYAEALRTLEKNPMERGSPHSGGKIAREASLRADGLVHEANSVKGEGIVARDGNAELVQSFHGVRHQAFTARFINGRLIAVGDQGRKSLLTRCNRHGQPRGASSNN